MARRVKSKRGKGRRKETGRHSMISGLFGREVKPVPLVERRPARKRSSVTGRYLKG